MEYGHVNRSEGVAPAVAPATEDLFRRRNAEDYALWQRAGLLLEEHRRDAREPAQ